MLLKSHCFLVISFIKSSPPPPLYIFERLGCECLFLKHRGFTFINISVFYELLGYCHRRPFLLHGIFIGVGTQGSSGFCSCYSSSLPRQVTRAFLKYHTPEIPVCGQWHCDCPPPQNMRMETSSAWPAEDTKMSETWFSLPEKSGLAMDADANQRDRGHCH